MKIRKLNLASLLLIVLIAAFGQAQQAQKPGPEKDGYNDNKEHSLPCRNIPTEIIGKGPTGKANLDHSDFPVNSMFSPVLWSKLDNPVTNQFNQTVPDQLFAYTFHWTNSGKECCRCIDGATLTVKLKALQTGGVGSPSSGNDYIVVVSSLAPNNHVVESRSAWPNGATAGQIETLTFQIPCKYLANGHLSFYVEDDTAVLSATLLLTRCCLNDEGRDK